MEQVARSMDGPVTHLLDQCSGPDSRTLNRGCNNNLKDRILLHHSAPYIALTSRISAVLNPNHTNRQETTIARIQELLDPAITVEQLDILLTGVHRDVLTLLLLRVPTILTIKLVITQLHLPSRTRSVPV